MSERKSMPYDVVIVGAGLAGLAAAIRLKQLAGGKRARDLGLRARKGLARSARISCRARWSIPSALDELMPDWRDQTARWPMPVTDNQHWVLTSKRQVRHAALLMPPFMHNKGTYTAASAICAAGWPDRPRSWASRYSRALRPPKSCSTTTAR